MLEGWDLGFLACVGVVIFTSGVVVWLHWLWRQSVVRKEEIKRLLVLASEETARAELEATAEYGYGSRYGYDSVAVAEVEVEAEEPVEVEEEEEAAQAAADVSRRLEYQCEVCFSPTTTRCKQCKAVHYCSGKCQIIHWRHGHKDECQPFAISEQSDDMGDSSRQNLLKPIENRIHSGSAEVEGRNPAKPVEISSGKQGFSDYNFTKLPNLKDDVEVEHLTDKKESTSNVRVVSPSISNKHPGVIALGVSSGNASAIYVNNSNILDGHQPVYLVPKKIKGDHANKIKPSLSQHPIFVDPAENIASPLKGKVIKPSSVDADACYGSSTSSGSSIDGCNESSFSEPSTSSSGFWEGTVKLCRARGSVNDTSPSCSDEARDVDLLDGETSPYYYSEMARTVPSGLDKSGSHAKKVLSDDQHPPFSDINRPRTLLASSVEVNKAGLVARRSSLSYEKADDFSSRKVSTSGEAREPALCRDAKGSSFSSPSTEKSKSQVAGTLGIFQEKKPIERNYLTSKSSDEHLSSSIVKHNVETLKPVEIDSTHLPSTRSSDFHCQSLNARNSSKASVWKVVDHIKASKFARFNSLGAASDSVGRYSNKGLFPYELFVKLYNWNKVELHPCGLVNCGNSCYANVVLQCLTFTPPLSAYFLQGLHSKGGCKKRDWCFACEFEGLVLKAHQGNSPLSPSRILSNLQNIGSHLANGREEDAHEFLRYVIDTMQSLCLKEAGVSSSGSFEEETTLIGLTFGGYLRSKIECMRCGGKSERHEKMMDLTVEIGGDIGTLEEALRQFTHTETLDGENKYHCSRCKSYEKARKKLRVLEAPNILTIALKRFQSGRFGKLNKTIKFPEILDLAPYMSGTSDKSPVYRLYGVVVHLDLMNAAFSGHYVCYVKNAQNKWFKLDDSSVKAVELEKVLSKDAYMLLYARCSPRAPRVLRSSLNSRDIRKSKHFDCKTRYSPRGPLDVPVRDSSNGRNYNESAYPSYSTFQPIRRILEDDSSSENSSSFFSEGNSCSTDSSNRDSTSTDDYFDQIFAEVGWNSPSPWRNSSDSETSSSSSSPSPMYFRHSDSDHYAARYSETGISCTDAADSERRGGNHFLCPDSTKHCRKLDDSSSCKESSSSKLERANPFDNVKSSLSFRNR